MRASTAFLVMLPMLLVTLLFVATQERRVGSAEPMRGGPYWDEATAAFVRQRVARTYVDELSPKEQADAFWRALDAYVRLDPYCDFIPPAEYRQWQESTAGRYGGLGIRIDPEAEGLRILGALPRGPAARAGLVPGDLIVSADGRSLGGLDLKLDSAARLLKGPAGGAVKLLVRRAAGEGAAPGTAPPPGTAPAPSAPPLAPLREVVVVREIVRPPGVFVRRVGPRQGVGVIRIAEFAETTPDEFDSALNGLLAQSLDGLVLDLRDNVGGVLTGAVHVVDRFLARGVVVRIEGRAPGTNRTYEAHPVATGPGADVSDTLPFVVLVNGHSASASEVVAGALQDHRRALLVGERTYGKFLVQQIVEAPRGDCAVQLVTSRYYTPSGRSYQRRSTDGTFVSPLLKREDGVEPSAEPVAEAAGLLPDVMQTLSKDERKRLRQLWDNEQDRSWGMQESTPDVPLSWVDPQLERALEVLEGALLMSKIRSTAPPRPR